MTLYLPPDSGPAIASRSCLPSGGMSSRSTLAMLQTFLIGSFAIFALWCGGGLREAFWSGLIGYGLAFFLTGLGSLIKQALASPILNRGVRSQETECRALTYIGKPSPGHNLIA